MLRQELQEMTQNTNVADHVRLLKELTLKHPNSIQIVPSSDHISRYTCLMHALAFTEKQDYIDIVTSGDGRIFAGADFAHWLLKEGYLHPLCFNQLQVDDLVIYFCVDRFKHIGLWKENNRVLSKWGTGNLYDHKLMEVPSSYGETVCFYRAISYQNAIAYFKRYAKSIAGNI